MSDRRSHEIETLTIRIPLRLQRRGGRKLIMMPEGAAAPARKPTRDETLVRALVRAHRWRRRIESGQAKSVTDLAEQEGVTDAYVCRLLPLTCLAPDIVEAILDGWNRRGRGSLRCSGRAARVGGAVAGFRVSFGRLIAAIRLSSPRRCAILGRPHPGVEARHGYRGLAAESGLGAVRARVS